MEMNNEQKPVAWMVRDGVVDYQLVKRKEQADHLVAELQKRYDLSGVLAAFNAVALYTHPNPAVVAQEPRRNITYVCPVCVASLERQE